MLASEVRSPSSSTSQVACLIACSLGLHGRTALSFSKASERLKSRYQYMKASAVAGARPKPVHPRMRFILLSSKQALGVACNGGSCKIASNVGLVLRSCKLQFRIPTARFEAEWELKRGLHYGASLHRELLFVYQVGFAIGLTSAHYI